MNRTVRTGAAILLVVLMFITAVLSPSIWLARGLFGALLVGGSLLLTVPTAVSLGIMTIPADMTLIARSPNSLDLLIWGGYALLAGLVSRFNNPHETFETGTQPHEDNPNDEKKSLTTSDNVDYLPKVAEETDPVERIQNLLVNRFRDAHEVLSLDNLVYFHVRDDEARLGYVINKLGDIKTDLTINSDQVRGVGWVLKHREELVLEQDRIDWRNLPYHKRPVKFEELRMIPIATESKLIGVIVLEWSSSPELNEKYLERFIKELESLLVVDRAVRRMKQKERRLDLVDRLNKLEPFPLNRPEAVRGTVKDLTRDLIPADHVEFVSDSPSPQTDNVLGQRQFFYEECCEWIRSRGSILRINTIEDFTFKGKRVSRFAPPDVTSFLGGAMMDGSGCLGFLCLDDPREGYFSREDEKVLKLLIDRTTGLMRATREVSKVREDRNRVLNWIDGISSLEASETFADFARQVASLVGSRIPGEGVAIYSRESQTFHLKATDGSLSLRPALNPQSTFINRLENCRNQETVAFPNIRSIADLNASEELNQMVVCPLFSAKGKLQVFVCLFGQETFPERTLKELRQILPILRRELRLLRGN